MKAGNMISSALAVLAIILFAGPVFAADTTYPADTIVVDSVRADAPKSSAFQRLINYFARANDDRPDKRFDFSILGGPHYSSDVKLGLGIVAAGIYRMAPGDSATLPSNVSLYGDVSTSGFFMVGIRGNHISRANRRRADYDLYFSSFPTKYWGVGYASGRDNANRTDYKELCIDFLVNYTWRVAPNLYIGPSAQVTYIDARNVENLATWGDELLRTMTLGVGGILRYDTRDNLTATLRGWMLSAEQRFCPRFLGNGNRSFSFTRLTAATFMPLWRDCTLALQARAVYNYGRVPWAMMATFGGNSSMRGYYKGQYRDKTEADFTVEFRQHLWHRIGMTVWGGVATVAPTPAKMRLRHILPNLGVGYRWEFKKQTNVRVDYGIGRGCSSFIFSINEAF